MLHKLVPISVVVSLPPFFYAVKRSETSNTVVFIEIVQKIASQTFLWSQKMGIAKTVITVPFQHIHLGQSSAQNSTDLLQNCRRGREKSFSVFTTMKVGQSPSPVVWWSSLSVHFAAVLGQFCLYKCILLLMYITVFFKAVDASLYQ